MNILEKIKYEFEKFPEVEIVILFGSAVKDRLIRQSDIDIAFAQKTITSFSNVSLSLKLS